MDLKNHADLEKLIKILRNSGVDRLKIGEFEIQMNPTSLFPETTYLKKKKEKELQHSSQESVLAEQEKALYWSSFGGSD